MCFGGKKNPKIISRKSCDFLHKLIENYPYVIPSPNSTDKMYVKGTSNFLKKHKNLLQTSVIELCNGLASPFDQSDFSGTYEKSDILCISNTLIWKYICIPMEPTISQNITTCGYETYISSILCQSESNKWQLRKMEFLKYVWKLWINTICPKYEIYIWDIQKWSISQIFKHS